MSIQNIKKALFMGAALFSFNAHAQIEKGATSLGGSFNTAITKNGMSTNLSPSYGRFITDIDVQMRSNIAVIGKDLVKAGVDFARQNNLKIIPLCPFAKAEFEKHADYTDVLAD